MFSRFRKPESEELKKEEQVTDQNQTEEGQQDEQVSEVAQKLENCMFELSNTKDQLVRLGADFQNYKRRIEQDQVRWNFVAKSSVIKDLLSCVDDFDRALSAGKEAQDAQVAQWVLGFELIQKRLYDMLKQHKVERITQVTTFDPELHEAVMQVESSDHTQGAIVQVLEQGFTFEGKVLRPAKVSVAQ